MNLNDPIADLVQRTLANLHTIDDLVAEGTATYKPFEVTQIVNSLLSLLVVPRELGTVEFVGRASVAPHIHLDGIRKWHRSPVEFELRALGGKAPQHLKKLLGGLRNSVAHANFKFIADAQGTVSALKFTHCARGGTPLWSVEFRVTELRNFLLNLGDELVAARDCQKSRPNRVSDIPRAQETDLEIKLPRSTLERINRLIEAHEADSVGQFIQDAVEAKLRDDEDLVAA